jgi:hypothetical protein
MEWLPIASVEVENVALPADNMPVPSVVLPSMKVTMPVGVPPPLDTVAVNVTDWPTTLVLGDPSASDVEVEAVETVSVKPCVASGGAPLEAVTNSGKEPVAAGVPESVAVLLPLSAKLTPLGNDPTADRAVVGVPVVVNVKLPKAPKTKVV